MRARIAWVLAWLTLALIIADVAVTAAYRTLLSEEAVAEHGFPFVNLAVLGSALLGAIIVSRYERHAIGWLLTLVGITSAFSLVTEAYSIWVVSEDGPGSRGLGGVVGVLSSLVGGQLAIGGLALLFLLAPDGHLLSRRWRYAAAAIAAGELCCVIALLAGNPADYDVQTQVVGHPARQVLFSIGFLLISVGLVSALVSMTLRLRRSRGVERQQVRLIAVSAMLVVGGLVALFVTQLSNGGEQTWVAALPLFTSYFLLPILIAVAVLRYRLYDIDVILNRAVVLAVGTAFAAVGYTTLVVAVGNQVDSRTGSFGLSLLGIALVALAFQPLRLWVVNAANRLAYGPRARPYVALSEFSRRLTETPTADALLPAVADAAARAVDARGATVTLDVAGTAVASASWGDVRGEGVTSYDVAVHSGGTRLGSVTVFLAKGRSIRPADGRLLQALADQAAVAFRNTAMETQLAEHVVELDRTTHQLAESRSRIIEADDAARRRLEAAISKEVLPNLVALPGELSRARAAVAAGSAENGLDEMVASTNAALESLRELTRGVFPTQLARTGLEPALRSHLARSGLAATLEVADTAAGQRFSDRVEAAVYFCCAEASRAMSDRSSIELTTSGDGLVLRITGLVDDVIDLQAVTDRVAAVDGSLSTEADQLALSIPDALAGPAVVVGVGPGL